MGKVFTKTPHKAASKADQTALKQALRPGQNGYQYKRQFGLVIKCCDEADQQRLYGLLLDQGIKTKVVCV